MKVIIQPKAVKQIKKIGDAKDKVKILQSIKGLKDFPQAKGVKPLKDHSYGYRLRVGNFRILFNDFIDISIISVEEVKKRDERTY